MEVVVIDVRTTGPRKHGDQIIGVAAAVADLNELKPKAVLDVAVKFDDTKALPHYLEAACYDMDLWARTALSPADAMQTVDDFLSRHRHIRRVNRKGEPFWVAQLVGHNASWFDAPFLKSWFDRSHRFFPADFIAMDTCQWARWEFAMNPAVTTPKDYMIGTLAEYFSIDLPDTGAKSEVLAVIELARHLRLMNRLASTGLVATTETSVLY